jgi:replicative superfamily II helicase
MINFAKELGKEKILKKTDPLEIYATLDSQIEVGPMRPCQITVLKEWYTNRANDHDLIVKLHTGEGKTLIGLLILLSNINASKGKCLYLCPNKQLVLQTVNEAIKFGIPYTVLEAKNEIPDSFLSGEKILICPVQMVFNGKTKFGLDARSIDIDTLVLDDSHACIESINSAFSLKLDSDHKFYKSVLTIFEDDLSLQGAGTFLEVKAGEYDSFLPIPYWSWLDKQTQVLEALSPFKDDNDVQFVWPLLKDSLYNYRAFVSGKNIELSPIHIPIERFGSFFNARQRVLMSATTQNDSFFINGLDMSVDAIKSPIINPDAKWSGEKMIVIPSLIDDWLERDSVISNFCKKENRNSGVVSIVPSFNIAKEYEKFGAKIATKETISSLLLELKQKRFDCPLVLVNRYDGIDLPDDSCRILILDSKPFFDSINDKYEESCRKNSDEMNVKIAQKVEQGLGRSVRGERDYSVIFIIGYDLIKFIKSPNSSKYFNKQTQKQIEIGLRVAELAIGELEKNENHIGVLKNLIIQVLSRDDGWKEFYKTEMEKVDYAYTVNQLSDNLTIDHEAGVLFYKRNYEKASATMQGLVDKISDPKEKAWYIQKMAHYTYLMSKARALDLQKSCFSINQSLLMPIDGVIYKKIEYINENRINRIKKWILQFTDYEELALSVNGTFSSFSFGVEHDKFEDAVREIGDILGFVSQRPDKEYKKGPDNLWCGVDNHYFIIECKSEVEETRKEIDKSEASQMNTHCAWFENIYHDAKVTRLLIIPTKKLSYAAEFTHEIKIVRKGKIRELRMNVLGFIKELKTYKLSEISNEKLQEFIDTHHLSLEDLKSIYSENPSK